MSLIECPKVIECPICGAAVEPNKWELFGSYRGTARIDGKVKVESVEEEEPWYRFSEAICPECKERFELLSEIGFGLDWKIESLYIELAEEMERIKRQRDAWSKVFDHGLGIGHALFLIDLKKRFISEEIYHLPWKDRHLNQIFRWLQKPFEIKDTWLGEDLEWLAEEYDFDPNFKKRKMFIAGNDLAETVFDVDIDALVKLVTKIVEENDQIRREFSDYASEVWFIVPRFSFPLSPRCWSSGKPPDFYPESPEKLLEELGHFKENKIETIMFVRSYYLR